MATKVLTLVDICDWVVDMIHIPNSVLYLWGGGGGNGSHGIHTYTISHVIYTYTISHVTYIHILT